MCNLDDSSIGCYCKGDWATQEPQEGAVLKRNTQTRLVYAKGQ